MIDNKDFSPLSKAHNYNFKLAKLAMEEGITPVIVDNTNIFLMVGRACLFPMDNMLSFLEVYKCRMEV